MKIRWIICLLISLGLHITWLGKSPLPQPVQSPEIQTPVEVVHVTPEPVAPEKMPLPEETPAPSDEILIQDALKLKPNLTPPEEAAPESGETEHEPEAKPTSTPESPDPESTAATIPTPAKYAEKIAEYRHVLLQDYEDHWQKVPALNTTIADLSQLPKIDRYFEITALAYGFVDQQPARPFYVFNYDTDQFEKMDDFDFSPFSNRIKDRMFCPHLQERLDQCRQKYQINSLVKIVGLIPSDTDRYFAAKQFRAVQLAGINPDAVVATNGHYEANGAAGFNLIIDSVQTVDGSVIAVNDEERQYSIVQN